MKPLQALLTWATYEVSVGMVIRDFEPLALAPLDEKLQEIELRPAGVFAALRHSIRNSLRVLRVAMQGLHGIPNVDAATAAAFDSAIAALQLSNDRTGASEDCQTALKHADALFELPELDEDLLYQTIAYSDAILSPRAIDMQGGFASSYLTELLRIKLEEGSPLLRVLEKRDLLLEGISHFFIEQVRVVSDVDEMLTAIAETDAAGLREQIESRRRKLASKLDLDSTSDLKRQVLAERIDGLENLSLTVATQLDIAHRQIAMRDGYAELMRPVLASLDDYYIAIESGAYAALDDSASNMPAMGDEQVERYTMPLEGEEGDAEGASEEGEAGAPLPNDPEAIFKLATDEFRGGSYNKAIRLYNRAIDLDPAMAPAHFNLSQAYLRRGRWSNALASYQQSVFIDSRCRMVPPEFEIEEILGAGGMGILFRGIGTEKNRQCTIRMIKPSLATSERMAPLVTAIKQLRAVESEAMVRIYDLRTFKQHLLMFCEYARGTSLRQVVDAQPMGPHGAITLMRQVAECIANAHKAGVYHNNLKPSCIFVDETDSVRVSEFALMALIGNDPGELQAAGLPTEYLAPEQRERQQPSAASDVYAMGMIFYEMLHGSRWQAGLTFSEGEGSPIDPRLAALMNQALSPRGEDRCSAAAMCALLSELAPSSQTSALSFDMVMALDDDDEEDDEEDGDEPPRPPSGTAPRPPSGTAPRPPSGTRDAPAEVSRAEQPARSRGKGPVTKGMTFIPAGPFIMGSDSDPGASPQHEVHLEPYWIDTTAVTNRQYREFVLATGAKPPFVNAPWASPYNWRKKCYPVGTDDHPVVLVNWYDAVAYAKWLGKRLPTEAEWEKACRGTDGREFPWGDSFDGAKVNYMRCSGAIGPVDAIPAGASHYGCLAMAGNVWEWVADWYDKQYYGRSPLNAPAGPKMGREKVIRGGAFDSVEEAVRTYFRFHHQPRLPSFFIGFRLAISASDVGPS